MKKQVRHQWSRTSTWDILNLHCENEELKNIPECDVHTIYDVIKRTEASKKTKYL